MTNKRGRVIAAATDGACSGNPGPGGWGALLRFEDGSVEEFGGHEPSTTNNRMELQAALSLFRRLKELPRHPDLKIRTDSKYLINGLSDWLVGWKRKSWRTASGKPVLNQDLWKDLDLAQLADVSLEYVKGHSGDPDNDRVDQIAVSYSKGKLSTQNSLKISANQASNQPKSNTNRVKYKDAAPQHLQTLLSKLELIDRLADGGYGLRAHEIAELIDESIEFMHKKKAAWKWRQWSIEPMENDLWRFKRCSVENFNSTKENKDG